MHDLRAEFQAHFGGCPLVGILRGIAPHEVDAVGDSLVDAGISIIEVPLNSPDPFESIARLARRYGSRALVGAGTVLTVDQVAKVAAAGGKLVVSPNVSADVTAASVRSGLVSLPGYFTPTEAFAAITAGAHGLKLFPAEGASPALLKAQRAVLPPGLPILVVGGISPNNMAPWRAAGADGFGLGSGLYRPGKSVGDIAADAAAYVAAVNS